MDKKLLRLHQELSTLVVRLHVAASSAQHNYEQAMAIERTLRRLLENKNPERDDMTPAGYPTKQYTNKDLCERG